MSPETASSPRAAVAVFVADASYCGLMRSLAATLALSSLVLVAAGWAGAVPPPPPPKFWTVSHCERALHMQGDDVGLTVEGYRFHVGLRVCVGTGGSQACQWTPDHRSQLYSQFRVFSRSRYVGSIVRSWTLATRGGHGLVAISHLAEGPPGFYMSPASVKLLARNSTPAHFRSFVAPIAARLTQQTNASGCTGG